jgi:hypothetical protein
MADGSTISDRNTQAAQSIKEKKVKYLVKRSLSPDGRINSVSVEAEFDSENADSSSLVDTILHLDRAAMEAINQLKPESATPTTLESQLEASIEDGSEQTLNGTVQAVFDGEQSRSGKMGPGAIIIDGVKVKTFDKKKIEAAKMLKGKRVEAVYVRNEKWRSNDLKVLEGA